MQGKSRHPIFEAYHKWSGMVDFGFQVNFLGVRTRRNFTNAKVDGGQRVQTEYPAFGEEYFEWIDLLEAVAEAGHDFTMLELGAGYGRWLVNAAAALRQVNKSAVPHLIGVEAEPTHFQWMNLHFRDNGLDPDEHLLVQAAIAPEDGTANFFAGYSREYYGQSLVPPLISLRTLNRKLRTLSLRLRRKSHEEPWLTAKMTRVKTVSLRTILRPLGFVNLIDLDVQGAEYDVLKAAAPDLDEKVRRVHIGTHGRRVHIGTHGKGIEEKLREMFLSMGWNMVNDYSSHSKSQTPYGEVSFGDGVQTWLNLKLRQAAESSEE
jgi:FkbM family methyltransferase